MRILAVSQYYWPEPFNVADMCEELVRRGHEVTVLTGLPNYPEGDFYPGYEDGRAREEERNGVRIVRVPMRPRKTGAVNRFLNYETFSRNATKKARAIDGDYDVVFAYEVSPVMSAEPALEYARLHGKPAVVYVLDIWPECLLSGGVKKGSLVYRHYEKVARSIYSRADLLAVSSPRFEEYIRDLPVHGVRCVYLPQYAEDLFSEGASKVGGDRDIAGYGEDGFDLTFAGNVGAAQAVDTLVRAASRLDGSIRIHIVGSGSELDRCKRIASELQAGNVRFHGRRPLGEMPLFYAKSDALIVSFADDPVIGYTLPRKLQTYLAAGKPVLGTLVGEAGRVIAEADCGLCCNAEDPDAFASICREFAGAGAARRDEWGLNARAYYEGHFRRDDFFDRLESALAGEAVRCCERGEGSK